MIDPLCKPCGDAGVMRKAHYLTNPPTCREHYELRGKLPVQKSGSARLDELRSQGTGDLPKRDTPPQTEAPRSFRKCESCLESGDVTKATHRMNGLDMCVTHANAAAVIDGPPESFKPEDVEVKSKKEKTMAGSRAKIDWTAAQKDRSDGMSVEDVAAKYGISQASVYTKTKRAGSKRPGPGQGKTKTKPQPTSQILGATLVPSGLLTKWNLEADAVFAALPLEKKAELLSSLK